MNSLPKLNFPAIRLRARRRDGRVEVWDEVRRGYFVLTPEEWVRRHLVSALVVQCGAPLQRIAEEYPVPLNGQAQRADVVVMGADARPLLLAECKAPDVAIDGRTWDQAVRYNAVVGARYLVLTNGREHYCCERAGDSYRRCESLPDLRADSDRQDTLPL